MNYIIKSKGIVLHIDEELLYNITEKAISSYPNETGGVLVGRISSSREAYIVSFLTPSRIHATPTSFVRDLEGTEEKWKEFSNSGLEYIGEWHSHPNGTSAYSYTDKKAMEEVVSDSHVYIKTPIMLIIAVNSSDILDYSFFLFKHNKLIKYTKMIDFKELFGDLQSEMLRSLQTDRTHIFHSVSKGDASENKWIEFLRNYLPNRYKIDKAMVIDSKGDVSEQIDIVIYDALYTPFILNHDGFKYIPAEGVYAVFEVKQELNSSYIDYAAGKIESVRKLYRTSIPMVASGKILPERPISKIIGGVLATTSSYSKKDTLQHHLENLKGYRTIDLGCAVDSYSFYVDYEGLDQVTATGMDAYTKFYDERKCKSVAFNKKENSLFTFFLQLVHYLKCIGTVPAIDINSYLNEIGESIDSTF